VTDTTSGVFEPPYDCCFFFFLLASFFFSRPNSFFGGSPSLSIYLPSLTCCYDATFFDPLRIRTFSVPPVLPLTFQLGRPFLLFFRILPHFPSKFISSILSRVLALFSNLTSLILTPSLPVSMMYATFPPPVTSEFFSLPYALFYPPREDPPLLWRGPILLVLAGDAPLRTPSSFYEKLHDPIHPLRSSLCRPFRFFLSPWTSDGRYSGPSCLRIEGRSCPFDMADSYSRGSMLPPRADPFVCR